MPIGWERATHSAVSPDDLRTLTDAAISAALHAGASYVDVHVCTTKREDWFFIGTTFVPPAWNEVSGVGVRALVDGCWGVAGQDGTTTVEAASSLGRAAAQQARVGASRTPQAIALAPLPVTGTAHWTMPVEIDPFTVSHAEKIDFVTSMHDDVQRMRYGVYVSGHLSFIKEQRGFASTTGALLTQTVYNTGGDIEIRLDPDWKSGLPGKVQSDFLTVAGAGWEYVRAAPYRESSQRMIAIALESRRSTPVDVGRYDLVFDAAATSVLVDNSIGVATELDRAIGDTANSVGTSYIHDPNAMLGTLRIGSPLLTVTTNRSMPGGAATIRWDDEGVVPIEATLVSNGILSDMQTTRETAPWIASYYARVGRSVRSNGCAGVYRATEPVVTRSPNFSIAPGTSGTTFDDLVKDTRRGIAIIGGYSRTDYQALTGYGQGMLAYTITNGTIGRPIRGVEFVYRSPEFWKGLVALGGEDSARVFGQWRVRHPGLLTTRHSVQAVPMKIVGVSILDLMRRA